MGSSAGGGEDSKQTVSVFAKAIGFTRSKKTRYLKYAVWYLFLLFV
jgi:hypothetical protein